MISLSFKLLHNNVQLKFILFKNNYLKKASSSRKWSRCETSSIRPALRLRGSDTNMACQDPRQSPCPTTWTLSTMVTSLSEPRLKTSKWSSTLARPTCGCRRANAVFWTSLVSCTTSTTAKSPRLIFKTTPSSRLDMELEVWLVIESSLLF